MNRRAFLGMAASLLALPLAAAHAGGERTLTTEFTYTAIVPTPAAGTKGLDVWLPVPSDGAFQAVRSLEVDAPGGYSLTRETRFGNRMVFLHRDRPVGPTRITVRFVVARRDVRGLDARPVAQVFPAGLAPDARVPVGARFQTIAREQTRGAHTILNKERALFRHVIGSMTYDYKKVSPEYARGDAAFVCDYKSGNCSDLHSYLIALSRSAGVPACLEFGFPLSGVPVAAPLPRSGRVAGYHCWTWFRDGTRGWVPLDAADARRWTDSGRPAVAASLFGGLVLERSAVAVSRGRDLTLAPAQKAGPLNYFIYPYAEADGVPTPATWDLHYHVLSDTHSRDGR